jgi:stage IV sporulation protein FA
LTGYLWTKVSTNTWLADSPLATLHFFPEQPALRASAYPSGWYTPMVGAKIVESFKANGKGILLQTSQPTEVRSIGPGIVVVCTRNPRPNGDWTVVITHPDGSKSIYGMLPQASVRIGSRVKGGEPIGWVQQGRLFVAFKQGEVFLDPAAVIGLD